MFGMDMKLNEQLSDYAIFRYAERHEALSGPETPVDTAGLAVAVTAAVGAGLREGGGRKASILPLSMMAKVTDGWAENLVARMPKDQPASFFRSIAAPEAEAFMAAYPVGDPLRDAADELLEPTLP